MLKDGWEKYIQNVENRKGIEGERKREWEREGRQTERHNKRKVQLGIY